MLEYEHEYDVCPVCGSRNIVFDQDQSAYVCANCGYVLDQHPIFYGSETRSFDETLPRTSGSNTFKVHDHGIGSTEFGTSSSYGGKWVGIARIQKSIRVNKSDKIVEKALRYLNKYVKILNAPNYVAETAAMILRETVKDKNYKNKTLSSIAIASIYVAFKIHGIKKPAKLFSKEAGISLKELWHAERKIHDAIRGINTRMKKEDPAYHVSYIVKKLGLSPQVEKLALGILNESIKLGLDIGKPAVGLATASVYLASILLNEKKTQIEIASVVNVTDVTIRNRYSDIVNSFDIVVYI